MDFLKLVGAGFLILVAAFVLLALSAAVVGWLAMLAIGILAGAGVVPSTIGFWPDAFWLGFIMSLLGTGAAAGAKS